MAEKFQDQFSSNLSSENYLCDFTSDVNDREEPKKDDEDVNDKDIIVIEERVVAATSDPEFITLEELADSDFIRNRQLAARSIVENLLQAGSNKEALHSVISVMCKLSEDEDSVVRSELIEQLPSIALFCKENSEDLGVVIRQQIVPYTVKLLTDIQRQIRKTGHSVLIVLLENNIIDHSQLSEWICPLIAQLVTSENIPEELKLEDVSVMCKMIPYVGKEITEKFFLEPFLTICRDSTSARELFYRDLTSAREVCMLNFGTISQAIGRELTEKTLLPTFLDLCQESWHVKAKCVNIAVDLAMAVSPRTRNEILSSVYISFLKDYSHAVSQAAYLSLGRFISTFAEPSKSGLKYKDGLWIGVEENDNADNTPISHQYHQTKSFDILASKIISKPDFLEECSFKYLNSTFDVDFDELSSTLPSSNFNNCKLQFEENEAYESSSYSSETFCDSVFISNFKNLIGIKNSKTKLSNLPNLQNIKTKSSLSIPSKEKQVSNQVHNENIFNTFQFWRMPLPEIDLAIEECKSSSLKTNVEENFHSCSSNLALNLPTKPKEPDILQDTDNSKLCKGRESPELNLKNYVQFTKEKSFNFLKDQQQNIYFFKEKPDNQVSLNEKHMTDTEKLVYDQDIVPPELLMEYIYEATMNDEDVKNVAFYFPSVTYALGRKHWPCIRDLFNTISSLFQFNIRKTVASSLHELAIILGPEITTEDLLPVFLKMLQDLGIRYTSSLMQNVSEFLKKTKPEARRQFLPLIEELCSWDYDDHNWRYRLTVSEQLTLSVELFSSHEALCFLPAALLLLQDKVSAVRRSGVELLAVIIKSIATNPESSTFLKATLSALDERCRKSNKWLTRQLYVFMCQDLAAKRSLPTEFYVEVIIPNLFSLAWDAVPNVRLAVARCVALTLLPLDFLPHIEKMHYSLLLQVLYSLQNDVDKDVRHFGQLCVTASGIFKSDTQSLEKESSAPQFKENDKQSENCL